MGLHSLHPLHFLSAINTTLLVFLIPLFIFAYVWLNDAKLTRLPAEAASISPERWTDERIQRSYTALRDSGKSSLLDGKLPPKTGRRYVVVGGVSSSCICCVVVLCLTASTCKAGFLGGWIVLHLLQRGEDPHNIRILDIRPPMRKDLLEHAKDVDFIQLDITNRDAVFAAFRKPWPASTSAAPGTPKPEVTIFHTAATIRFYERHPELLHLSESVNVNGTQNILDAARAFGVRTLVYTSSGSVSVRRSRFWLLPWQKEPEFFTQVISDADAPHRPRRHEEFFSNYAASKLTAEGRVRAADRTPSGKSGVLRTGCIRPGNGVYGPGGDLLVGGYLVQKFNPTWIGNIVQSFTYVENCSFAHLLYEQRLLELERGAAHPDIGGDAFCIADGGAPPTFGDIHRAVHVLSDGRVRFTYLSPTTMLAIAHLVEWYYLTRRFLLKSTYAFLAHLMPQVIGDIVFLQPSMFALTNVNLHFDDSRARAPPEKGGLGYAADCTTMEGVCAVVLDHFKNGGKGEVRMLAGHAEPKQSPLVGAEHAVGTAMGKIEEGLDATKALN